MTSRGLTSVNTTADEVKSYTSSKLEIELEYLSKLAELDRLRRRKLYMRAS
jgi:hypothetical protein